MFFKAQQKRFNELSCKTLETVPAYPFADLRGEKTLKI